MVYEAEGISIVEKKQKKANQSISDIKNLLLLQGFTGGVVQLVRMPACHAGGREFESRRHRLKQKPRSYVGFFIFQEYGANLFA